VGPEWQLIPIANTALRATPLGLRLTKEAARFSIDAPSMEAAVAMEDRNQVLCCLQGADFPEGVAALLEKRAARHARS
jgi:enoyl-CoA hydratase